MKYRLGDICDIYDGPHATPPETKAGPVFLGIKNINEQCELDLSDVKYLSEADYAVWTKRVTPQTDDIVFSYEATLNRYALIPNSFYGCLGRRLAIARVKDKTKVNPHFLYHYFCAPKWQAFVLANKVIGSTVLRVSIEDFPHYVVDLPDISTQSRIALILDDISEKKRNNTAICADLEAMAKLLYDYWFVQFDFPDENGKPYKSSGGKMVWNEELKREIPEGWEVSKFDDLVDIAPKLKAIMAPDYREKGKYPIVDQASNLITGYTDDKQYVFPNNTGCVVFGDVTTYFKFINFPFAKGTDGTKIIRAKNERIPALLFYHLIKDCRLPNVGFARHYMFLREVKVLIPPKPLCEEYERKTRPLMEAWRLNIQENQQLASLRDFLLPMLMNGQVKVGKETI